MEKVMERAGKDWDRGKDGEQALHRGWSGEGPGSHGTGPVGQRDTRRSVFLSQSRAPSFQTSNGSNTAAFIKQNRPFGNRERERERRKKNTKR